MEWYIALGLTFVAGYFAGSAFAYREMLGIGKMLVDSIRQAEKANLNGIEIRIK